MVIDIVKRKKIEKLNISIISYRAYFKIGLLYYIFIALKSLEARKSKVLIILKLI